MSGCHYPVNVGIDYEKADSAVHFYFLLPTTNDRFILVDKCKRQMSEDTYLYFIDQVLLLLEIQQIEREELLNEKFETKLKFGSM